MYSKDKIQSVTHFVGIKITSHCFRHTVLELPNSAHVITLNPGFLLEIRIKMHLPCTSTISCSGDCRCNCWGLVKIRVQSKTQKISSLLYSALRYPITFMQSNSERYQISSGFSGVSNKHLKEEVSQDTSPFIMGQRANCTLSHLSNWHLVARDKRRHVNVQLNLYPQT